TRRESPCCKHYDLQARFAICGATWHLAGRYQIRVWSVERRADLDRRGADAGFVAFLAGSAVQAGRGATIVRQTVCARLPGADSLAKSPARAGIASRRSSSNARQIPGGISHSGWARGGLKNYLAQACKAERSVQS